MPRNPKNLVRHELIGLDVEVVESRNKSQIGIKGKVVDETKHMLVIETKSGDKKIEKKSAVFLFRLPTGEKVRVEGWVIEGRPEDRIKKKLPRW